MVYRVDIAIVALESWEVIFENTNFFKWFPPGAETDELLGARIPRLKTDRVQKRIEAGRVFTSEVESVSGERVTPIAVEIRSLGDPFDDLLVVECHNITKQRQSEYMLQSYSKMAEKMPVIWSEKKIELNGCSGGSTNVSLLLTPDFTREYG